MSTSQKVSQLIAEAFADQHGIDLSTMCDSFDKEMATQLVQNTQSFPKQLVPPAPEFRDGRLISNGHIQTISPEAAGTEAPLHVIAWTGGTIVNSWTSRKLVDVRDANGQVVMIEKDGKQVAKQEMQDVEYSIALQGPKLEDSMIKGHFETLRNHPNPAVSKVCGEFAGNWDRMVEFGARVDRKTGKKSSYLNFECFKSWANDKPASNMTVESQCM